MSAHDRHLAGYRRERIRVRCSTCGEWSSVELVTEYGQQWSEPEECPHCGDGWHEDNETEPDEQDEDRAYDRYVEDREEMGDDGPTGIAAWYSQRHS